MSRLRTAAILASLAATGALASTATSASRLVFEDKVKANASSSVTVTVNRPAAFNIRLKTVTAGRTRLFLTPSPGGGALLDTKGGACEGAAGSLICSGAFESLPAGTYKFRILRTGAAANVALTVRW
jgi:hypothetical protein